MIEYYLGVIKVNGRGELGETVESLSFDNYDEAIKKFRSYRRTDLDFSSTDLFYICVDDEYNNCYAHRYIFDSKKTLEAYQMNGNRSYDDDINICLSEEEGKELIEEYIEQVKKRRKKKKVILNLKKTLVKKKNQKRNINCVYNYAVIEMNKARKNGLKL